MSDEGVARGFLSTANRPKLEAKGKKSNRRSAFDVKEIQKLLASFDGWIEKGRTDRSKEIRSLLRDYVEVLLDTGARPGDELMNLKWKQIKHGLKIVEEASTEMTVDSETGQPTPVVNRYHHHSCEMTVSRRELRRTSALSTGRREQSTSS